MSKLAGCLLLCGCFTVVPGGGDSGASADLSAAPAGCADGQKGGDESDVDCGGSCAPCAAGKTCRTNGDCLTASCTAGACAAASSCGDGLKDGMETDVDCGGGACPKCAEGKQCLAASDCAAGACTGAACCPTGFADCDGSGANGCEANLMTDAKSCGACGKACPMGQTCKSGACAGGPVVCQGGLGPPAQCQQGNDPESGDRWVTCFANCNTAWISHSEANGPQYNGKFHALQICNSLGYAQVAKWGCSYECSWCQGNPATCQNPGSQFFDHMGVDQACGNDQFGPILCGNVMWLCST